MLNRISEQYIKELESSLKIGLVATIAKDGNSHITVLSTIQANTPTQMIVGQFTEGLSKKHFKTNNKVGFLVMSLQKELWTGKMDWTHEKKEGEEYEMYNRQPMFRYNTYFGIHTVHFFDLLEISNKENLNMTAIIFNAIKTTIGKGKFNKKYNHQILKPWAEKLLGKLDTLKFLSYIDDDGYPIIVPIIQAQAVNTGTIAFSNNPYNEQLAKLKTGTSVSILGMNLDLENVMVNGVFNGFKNTIAGKLGSVDIHQVYNSMPPKPRYIYSLLKSRELQHTNKNS